MKPANQLNERDCLRACLASLLEKRTETIPDFAADPEAEKMQPNGHPKFWYELQAWLKGLGLFLLEMHVAGTFFQPGENGEPEELPVLNPLQPLPFEGYCILCGRTPGGTRHMVVGKHTGNVFIRMHDPHPNQPDLQGVESVCFLIPLDPSVYVRMGLNMDRIKDLTAGDMTLPKWSAVAANAREALGQSVLVKSGDVRKHGNIIHLPK